MPRTDADGKFPLANCSGTRVWQSASAQQRRFVVLMIFRTSNSRIKLAFIPVKRSPTRHLNFIKPLCVGSSIRNYSHHAPAYYSVNVVSFCGYQVTLLKMFHHVFCLCKNATGLSQKRFLGRLTPNQR